MTIFKGRLIFGSFIVFIIILIVIQITESNISNDVNYFKFQDVNTLIISDRGIQGNQIINIKDPKVLRTFAKIFKSSEKLSSDKINMKSNNGLCDIELQFKDQNHKYIILTNTTYDGGVIRSGSFYYRNDSLKNFIIKLLKSSRPDD